MKNLFLFLITFIVALSILCCWFYIIQRNIDANFSLKNIQFGRKRKTEPAKQVSLAATKVQQTKKRKKGKI